MRTAPEMIYYIVAAPFRGPIKDWLLWMEFATRRARYGCSIELGARLDEKACGEGETMRALWRYLKVIFTQGPVGFANFMLRNPRFAQRQRDEAARIIEEWRR